MLGFSSSMDPETCTSLRCGKHPSQTFTGFCAHCLVERLSAVDPGQRKAPSCPGGGPSVDGEDGIAASADAPEMEVTAVEKVANCSSVVPGIESESCNVRERQTLWSLFYSGNEGGSEDGATRRRTKVGPLIGKRDTSLVGIRFHDDVSAGFRPNPNGPVGNQLKEGFSSKASGKKFIGITETTNSCCDFGSNSEARSSSAEKTVTDMQLDETGNDEERIYFVSESRGPKSVANKYTQVEAVIDVNGENFPANDIGLGSTFGDCMDDQSFKRRPPLLLRQGFINKILRWNMKTSQKRTSKSEADLGVGFHDLQLQRMADNDTPCCRRESIDSNETCSWDGLLIGKTLTRSVSVKEEANDVGSVKPVDGLKEMFRQPGSLENGDCYSESIPHIRRMTKKVGSVDFEWSPDMKDMNKIIPAVVEDDNKLTSDIGYAGDSGRERFCGSLLEDWSCRGKFHGCGKIWSRVIASPFWGFVQKSENVLDRSLSECWHESRRERNRNTAELFNRMGFHRNSSVSVRSIDKSQEHRETSCNGLSTINADIHGFRSVWNKKKNYGVLGHSRSIHYSSPSNLDNGLLRFYLTPMRYNRRLTNRKSRRNLHYLW